MRFTTLIENKEVPGFVCEHGLAVFIEYRGHRILLDSGSSDAFLENAKKLGISLNDVDIAVLSHAHYDHSGGYRGFFAVNKEAKVYLQEEGRLGCYKETGSPGEYRYIGIPGGLLEEYPQRFVYVNGNLHLAEGVWLIAHTTEGLSEIGRRAHMCCRTKDGMETDAFRHEHSLVFETEKGLVVFCSCSHGGIGNIVEEVKYAFPGRSVYAAAGGFHLMGAGGEETLNYSEDEVRALARFLTAQGVKKIFTGHCTGTPGFHILKEELGERLCRMETGKSVEL